MDVNEEILEQYLKVVKNYFYVGDISFTVPSNYSNIDVLGYSQKDKIYYDFEVKYRSAFSLTNNDKGIEYLVEQFSKYKTEREEKIKEFIGSNTSVKVIVTTYTMMGKSSSKRTQMEERFHQKMQEEGFQSEIWYFDEMIPELVDAVSMKGKHNTQLLQTIRMLKTFT
ncbi:hypothetical protein [Sulfurovum riftiae]|uniref:Restriction endonuclease type IV Mrr domain-containing protein n=1 Tax=Sulfurovum riftiae TaxID=1630136 RepID=A0A151CIU2_9BACT|nr:hypothetical protein [Sulfurovum riftiae]KYJ87183.1 hypothetical protein AS592_11830 [Sulfurovum riftiae]